MWVRVIVERLQSLVGRPPSWVVPLLVGLRNPVPFGLVVVAWSWVAAEPYNFKDVEN